MWLPLSYALFLFIYLFAPTGTQTHVTPLTTLMSQAIEIQLKDNLMHY